MKSCDNNVRYHKIYKIFYFCHNIQLNPVVSFIVYSNYITYNQFPGDRFSDNLKNFVERCLQKNASDRIRLGDSHPFLGRIPTDESMLQWCRANQLLV